ncbi:2-keto-4-pentenoate hydratase/2-oxohepta-3-ene-1,7-dioic acid hydratase in catechol pathway [Streptacidiphilus sp. MAP12-16]|uniref:DUF2848 domain-containing protein n=1 Tax=Streptacidiphilus sp. MAP12-16 TaxID=3156300 RepID=UPI003511E52A
MSTLSFTLPDGTNVPVTVTALLNAGYSGRDRRQVAAHVAELAALGVPAPGRTPAVYPVAPYLAVQDGVVPVQHGRTSGEAEWAMVIAGPDPRDVLLTVASDHTDRDLETYGVGWSKQAGPDVLGRGAWRLADVCDRLDTLTLTAWVASGADPSLRTADSAAVRNEGSVIQRGTLADLLPPHYWLAELAKRGLHQPGTVLLSGTIPMLRGVDQFADHWRVALADPMTGRTLECAYSVVAMPEFT